MATNEVQYKTINDLNDIKDRIERWINHHRQPLAYRSPADDLPALAKMMSIIAGNHEMMVSGEQPKAEQE